MRTVANHNANHYSTARKKKAELLNAYSSGTLEIFLCLIKIISKKHPEIFENLKSQKSGTLRNNN